MDDADYERLSEHKWHLERNYSGLLYAKSIAEQEQIEGKLKAVDAALYHLRAALDLELLLQDTSQRTTNSASTLAS